MGHGAWGMGHGAWGTGVTLAKTHPSRAGPAQHALKIPDYYKFFKRVRMIYSALLPAVAAEN
ncbi:MAG: hypothetical protein KME26_14770 [Oscillatoria princeps RMCB-10]|nr:hypothetical protein [Oscillatoria princeps RMCB-10]